MTDDDGLHVAIVLSMGTGGLPHYGAELANSLSSRTEVTVIKPESTTADGLFDTGVHVEEVFTDSNLSFTNLSNFDISVQDILKSFWSYRSIGLLNEISPDVVHFVDNEFPPTMFFAWRNNIGKEFPVVVTLHEVYDGLGTEDKSEKDQYKNPAIAAGILGRKLLNTILPTPSVDQYVVHTEQHREKLTERLYDGQKVAVIPHGTYTIFEGEAETEDNTILFFGKIMPSKGLDVLVESVRLTINEIDDIKLIIAGEGDISDRSLKTIQDYPDHFEVRNEFIPNEKVGEYFERAQIVAVPHRKQGGHSGSLTIAQNFGKPIVASDIGGIASVIEKHDCGVLATPEDPTDFRDSIIQLLSNKEMRENMKENSKKAAQEVTWEYVADEHIQSYQRLVGSEGEEEL